MKQIPIFKKGKIMSKTDFIKQPDRLPTLLYPTPVIPLVPEVYQIEVASICNMKCIMCPTPHFPRKNKKPLIDVSLVEKIVNEGALEASYFVELQQSGEPLLHPELSEIIDIVKSTGVYVGLSTNGLLIEEQTEALSKLDYITFSLDSIDYYNEIRVTGKQVNLVEKIKNFLPIAKEKNIAIDIQIVELEGFEEQKKKIEKTFEGDNVLVRTMTNGYLLFEFPDMENTCNELCLNPWTSVSISCNGNVSACCISTGDGIQLGDINKQSLQEIWEGDEIQKLREEHMTRNYRYVCSKCYMRSPHLCHAKFFFDSIRQKNTHN